MADMHGVEYLIGAIGAGVRVAIGHERGEQQSKLKMGITVVAGSILAGTSAHAMTELAGLSSGFSGGMSFMIGLLGIGFVYQAIDGRLPFLQKWVDKK